MVILGRHCQQETEMLSPELLAMRILIVDDDDWNVAYIYEVLSAWGFSNIKGLSDSRLVAAEFQSQMPDILLLDVNMPFLNGFEVLEQIAQFVKPEEMCPVLVVTSLDDEPHRLRALEAGATDFLPKPFEEIVVVTRVSNLLRTRSLDLKLKVLSGEGAGGDAPAMFQDTERFRTLVANIPAAILLVGADGKVLLANEKTCQLFGLQSGPEKLLGVDWTRAGEGFSQLFANPARFLERTRDILLKGEPVDNEKLQLANGTVWERDYVPVKTSGGSVEHLWIFREGRLKPVH